MKLYQPFFEFIKNTHLAKVEDEFKQKLDYIFNQKKNGNLKRWLAAYDKLPDVKTQSVTLDQNTVSIGKREELSSEEASQLNAALENLSPWRKGPFDVFGTYIDTEWHSDWKWNRLAPHISNLEDKMVLDVGCGSGYHSWRMAGAGAKMVLGIDPSLLFVMQYLTIKKYAEQIPVFVLPFTLEDMPESIPCFDTVFSMGVLYHRRSPIDHLLALQNLLKPDGELILETLIIEGDENQVLMPTERYAKMRNVWFIPSVPELIKWMKRCGYRNVRCVDVNQTSTEEQRSTEWMQFESLPDFLNPNDSNLTIENYPAPKRAILMANK